MRSSAFRKTQPAQSTRAMVLTSKSSGTSRPSATLAASSASCTACPTAQRVPTLVRHPLPRPFHHHCTLPPLTLTSEPDSGLSNLLRDAIPLKPAERAGLLYESQALESAHQSAAAGGDTAAPAAQDSVDLHYVCFVKSDDNHLWEMDGRRKGPLDRGQLTADEDVLSDKALQLGVRSFLKREAEAGGGDLRFSLIVLAESLD